MSEPPYGIIWNLLKEGKVIPFLGAGASISGRPSGAEWDKVSATFLPKGEELAKLLADDAGFPSGDPHDWKNLAKVASYYLESSDRQALISQLRGIFNRDYQIGEVHRFLADLQVPLLIVTTNYDDLIERAFKSKSKPYHLVVHPTERPELAGSILWWRPGEAEPVPNPPSRLPLSVTDTTIIYKMHGTVDRQAGKYDSFVITEEDYVDFLSRMTGQTVIPARFMFYFRTRRFLFLGYGLADWNWRVVLKNLKTAAAHPEAETKDREPHLSQTGEELRSWAIQYKPSELERMLWQARKVNIYDIDLDAFITRMRERMK